MKNSNEISVLSASYLAGEMSKSQETRFLRMIDRDENLKREFRNLKEVWKKLELELGMEIPDSEPAWNKLHSRLDEEGLLPDSPSKKVYLSSTFIRVAASIIIFIAVALPAYFLLNNADNPAAGGLKYQAEQNISAYDLPDGSRVFLNKGSSISLAGNFQEQRYVDLDGEAYFDIMADPANPFIIQTRNAKVTVLGTSFNVKENRDTRDTEVFVESGKVKVKSLNTDEEIVLNPGGFAHADRRHISPGKKPDPNYLAWKTREFHFENEEIRNVFSLLEEVYQVKIRFNDQNVGSLRLTSSYSRQSIDAILNTIATAFNMQVTRKNGIYEVKKNEGK